MKKFDVYGIGNGLVDILGPISEAQFQAYGFERASMTLVDGSEQRQLIRDLDKSKISLVSGGSVANSIIAISQLGGSAAFSCCLGNDDFGQFYKKEFEELSIAFDGCLEDGEHTGTALVLITPDAERTMRVHLGVAGKLSAKHLSEELIADSKWVFIEGYLFASPTGKEAIAKTIEIARGNGSKIALTLSDAEIVKGEKKAVEQAVESVDLVFANEEEGMAFAGTSSPEEAFTTLKEKLPGIIVTMGARGVLVSFEGQQEKVDAFRCTPVDLTGAGDAFAAAFLYGICEGRDIAYAARAGCYLASKVITQVGARLHEGARLYWDELEVV